MKIFACLLAALGICSAAIAQKTPTTANQKTTAAAPVTKFDKENTYVPGDSVLLIDDFTQEKPGNSPIKWKTSFASPIVEIAGRQWFKLLNNGEYAPRFIRSMPEKYTIEFDIVADGTPNEMGYVGNLFFVFGEAMEGSFTNTTEQAQITTEVFVAKDPTNVFHTNNIATTSGYATSKAFSEKRGQKIHIAFAVDKKRLRMWIENEKIIDDTLMIYSDKFDTFRIGLGAWNENDKAAKVLLSDFRYAAGPADVQKRMQQKGSFTTAGISFVPGTDQLAPGTTGAVARLAAVIQENAPSRFKIVAHTDADATNADELTRKRAEALKSRLVTDYKIDSARLETEGAGAKAPYAKGRSMEAKANNNRIEIKKL